MKPNQATLRAHRAAVGTRMTRSVDLMLLRSQTEAQIEKDLAESAEFYAKNKGDNTKIKIHSNTNFIS
jgi:hypothetical protein